MNKLINELGINEEFTRVQNRKQSINKVKNNIRHEPDYNFMADLLMLPETSKSFKYLFIAVDLYTLNLIVYQ